MVDGPYSISIFTASGGYDSDREPEPGNVAVLPNGSVYLIVRKWKIGMEVPKMAAPEVSFYGRRLDGANGVAMRFAGRRDS